MFYLSSYKDGFLGAYNFKLNACISKILWTLIIKRIYFIVALRKVGDHSLGAFLLVIEMGIENNKEMSIMDFFHMFNNELHLKCSGSFK